MTIILPNDVKYIIEKLEASGHQAYAVGGCVRDCIMGRIPADWDITTSAKPMEIKRIFSHTIDTGLQHGTVTVLRNHVGYEVTTYRVDGDYSDGRHPDSVSFTSDLTEDLARRDFTINAMAYNDRDGLVDVFFGKEDLNNGIIRAVGEPKQRFTEDALRMLRALRFSAQLNFEIEAATYEAITELAQSITQVSAERICVELTKLITSDHPKKLEQIYHTGLGKYILPEFDAMMECEQNTPHHCYTVGMHTLEAMNNISPERHLRFAMLLHDVAKPECKTTDEKGVDHFHGHPAVGAKKAKAIMRRLKMDNDTIDKVCNLVEYHDCRPELGLKYVRRLMAKTGMTVYPDLFYVKKADILAQSQYKREDKLYNLQEFERLYEEILAKNQCVRLSDLQVKGKDLIDAGIKPGPLLGKILNRLLEQVVEDPALNKADILIDMAVKYAKESE